MPSVILTSATCLNFAFCVVIGSFWLGLVSFLRSLNVFLSVAIQSNSIEQPKRKGTLFKCLVNLALEH